jgi:hypothetical protein
MTNILEDFIFQCYERNTSLNNWFCIPDEKAFSVADAPKDTRGFVENLLEKTEKFW